MVPSAGEVYGWKDDQGVARYTGQLDRVPASALDRTLRIRRDPITGIARAFPLHGEPLLARAGDVEERASALPARTPQAAASTLRSLPAATIARPAARDLPAVASRPPADAWAIQLEATEVSSWLQPLDSLQMLEGHRLYRTRFEVAGQPWQRLRLGFFPTLAAARAAAARLQANFPGAWIDEASAAEREASAGDAIETPERFGPGATALAHTSGEPFYTIQLRSEAVDGRLRALTRLELLEQHRLYRRTVESRGAVWERLRLGDFASFEAARAVLRELQASYPDAWIDRSEG